MRDENLRNEMPIKYRSSINYRLFFTLNKDEELLQNFIICISLFFGAIIFLIAFYILTFYFCGRKDDLLDDDIRRNRNKMLEFKIENKKWPEKSPSKTLQLDKIKKKENQIRSMLAS